MAWCALPPSQHQSVQGGGGCSACKRCAGCAEGGCHLAVVNHREHAERLDRDDGAHVLRRGANLHHVNGVVVAEGTAHVGVALDVGVLPCMRQAAVVPEDGAVVQARLALLLVLHDRVARDLGRHLPRGCMRAWHPKRLWLWTGEGRPGRTSIFLRLIFGISHTKLYMPSPASSGMSCHGEMVLPSCTRQHKTGV